MYFVAFFLLEMLILLKKKGGGQDIWDHFLIIVTIIQVKIFNIGKYNSLFSRSCK